jgi:hypothetical protein
MAPGPWYAFAIRRYAKMPQKNVKNKKMKKRLPSARLQNSSVWPGISGAIRQRQQNKGRDEMRLVPAI